MVRSYQTEDLTIGDDDRIVDNEFICPECGGLVIAVRRNANSNDATEPWYFRHRSDGTCVGWGESSCHKMAKQILKGSIGKDIVIPSVGMEAAMPHVWPRTGR